MPLPVSVDSMCVLQQRRAFLLLTAFLEHKLGVGHETVQIEAVIALLHGNGKEEAVTLSQRFRCARPLRKSAPTAGGVPEASCLLVS